MSHMHSDLEDSTDQIIFVPNRAKVEWTLCECILFLKQHEIYGNKWTEIAKVFPLKNQSDIKNHFYILLKKYISNIKQGKYYFDGHVDLIQCYYVVKHIIHFFNTNLKKKDHLRMLVLIEKLTEPMTLTYFHKFILMYPLFDKVGWKQYYEESNNFELLLLRGYHFPNRILPITSTSNNSCLSQEDKINFIHVFTHK